MEPVSLLHADYLDIVFDKRNKSYGGYELRKHYNQRVGKAALLLLAGVGALTCLSFVRLHKAAKPYSSVVPVSPQIIDMARPPLPLPKVEKATAPSPPPAHVKTQMFTEPVITDNELVKPGEQLTETKTIAMPGPSNADGDTAGIGPVTKEHGTGVVTPPATATNKPLVWVEQMPQFPGDMPAYINSHLTYPETARAANIEGRVLIQFVVNEDGSVSDAKIVRGIGGGCDEEALKIVSGMPKWKPGKQNGRAVKVFFALPVNFVLN